MKHLVKRLVITGVMINVLFAMPKVCFGQAVVQTHENVQAINQMFQQADFLKGQSQSYTHLADPMVQHKRNELENIHTHNMLIQRALSKELEMTEKGYVVFYTAIPYLRLFQDITRQLYKRKFGKVGALRDKEFQFIRYTPLDSLYSRYTNVSQFLLDEIATNGVIDDNQLYLKIIVVSTNIAFFGNVGLLGEYTWGYFNHPQTWVELNKAWLTACLESFDYSIDFIDELMQLAPTIVTQTGDLFQIFVPRKLVNSIGYLSWRHGIPFDKEYIEALMNRSNLSFTKADKLFITDVRDRIAVWKELYKQGDERTVIEVNKLLQKIRDGAFHLIPFMDEYRAGKLSYTNAYQARLLVSPPLLDPTKGLKIFRYTTLDAEREQAYKARLKDIFRRMDEQKQSSEIESIEMQEQVI